jgi:hypothetical protein
MPFRLEGQPLARTGEWFMNLTWPPEAYLAVAKKGELLLAMEGTEE